MKAMVGGCCVCSDERGWAENPLVYCDGHHCSVAVHQACYGIVQVPKGPWFCRKCESQERVARVKCELCPQKEGALKRADTGWCHVICALFIPEAWFANVQTMEPIVLKNVPQERFNKTCYICDENSKESRSTSGACMQCNKNGCKQHFHVTCAQAYGLLCEEAGSYGDNVKYCGYCSYHNKKLKKDANIKIIPAFRPIQLSESATPDSSPEKAGGKLENKDKLKTKDKKLDNNASPSSDLIIHHVSNSVSNQTPPQKSPSSALLMNNSDSSCSIASPTGFPGFTEADIKSATAKQKEEHLNTNNNNSKIKLNSINTSIDVNRVSPKHNSLNLGSGEPKIIMEARLSIPLSDGAYKLNPSKGAPPLSSTSTTTSSLTLPSNSQSSAPSRSPHPTNFGSSLAEMSYIASSILANESVPTCASKRKQSRAEKRAKKSKIRSQSVGSQEEVMMLKLPPEKVTSSSTTNSNRRRSTNAAVATTSPPGTSTPAAASAALGSNSNLNVFGGSPCFQTPISITSLTKQEPVDGTSSSISSSASSLIFGPPKPASSSSTRECFPASMEELLERQWEQGAQFLMEQGQHFDIAALLTCLHQLKNETNTLQDSIQTLSARRDRLLAINARLSIPFSGSASENSTESQSQDSPATLTDPSSAATTSSRHTLAANKQGPAGIPSSAGTSTGDKSAGESSSLSHIRDLPNGPGGGGKSGKNKPIPSCTHPNPAVASTSSSPFLPYPVTPSPILHGVHAGVSSNSPISHHQLTPTEVKGSQFPSMPSSLSGMAPHMLLDAQFQHFLASKALAGQPYTVGDQTGQPQFVYPGLLSGQPLSVNLPHPSTAAAILSNMQQQHAAYPLQVNLAAQNHPAATASKSSSSSSNKGKSKDKR